MEIIYKNIDELKPYKNNPRNNEKSIEEVAKSIKEFGFKVPIIIDKNGLIVAGHTRLEASKILKIKKIPCIVADDLSEEQIRAFRIVDNRVSEFSNWDFSKLKEELEKVDVDNFDFTNIETLDVSDDDFINEIKESVENEKKYVCPECGVEFK